MSGYAVDEVALAALTSWETGCLISRLLPMLEQDSGQTLFTLTALLHVICRRADAADISVEIRRLARCGGLAAIYRLLSFTTATEEVPIEVRCHALKFAGALLAADESILDTFVAAGGVHMLAQLVIVSETWPELQALCARPAGVLLSRVRGYEHAMHEALLGAVLIVYRHMPVEAEAGARGVVFYSFVHFMTLVLDSPAGFRDVIDEGGVRLFVMMLVRTPATRSHLHILGFAAYFVTRVANEAPAALTRELRVPLLKALHALTESGLDPLRVNGLRAMAALLSKYTATDGTVTRLMPLLVACPQLAPNVCGVLIAIEGSGAGVHEFKTALPELCAHLRFSEGSDTELAPLGALISGMYARMIGYSPVEIGRVMGRLCYLMSLDARNDARLLHREHAMIKSLAKCKDARERECYEKALAALNSRRA